MSDEIMSHDEIIHTNGPNMIADNTIALISPKDFIITRITQLTANSPSAVAASWYVVS